jgi:hypothetical protein
MSLTGRERIEWANRCHTAITKQNVKSVSQFKRDTKCPLSLPTLHKYVKSLQATGSITFNQRGNKPALGKALEDKVFNAVMERAARGEHITNVVIQREATKLAMVVAEGEGKADVDRRINQCSSRDWVKNWKERYNVVCTKEPTATSTATSPINASSSSSSSSSSYSNVNPTVLLSSECAEWARRCQEALARNPTTSIPQFQRESKCPISLPTLRKHVKTIASSSPSPSSSISSCESNAQSPTTAAVHNSNNEHDGARLDKSFEDTLYQAVWNKYREGEKITNGMIVREAHHLALRLTEGETHHDVSMRVAICTRESWIADWKARYKVQCSSPSNSVPPLNGNDLTKPERIEWAKLCHEAITTNKTKSIAAFKRESLCPLSLRTLHQYMKSIRETGSISLHHHDFKLALLPTDPKVRYKLDAVALAAASAPATTMTPPPTDGHSIDADEEALCNSVLANDLDPAYALSTLHATRTVERHDTSSDSESSQSDQYDSCSEDQESTSGSGSSDDDNNDAAVGRRSFYDRCHRRHRSARDGADARGGSRRRNHRSASTAVENTNARRTTRATTSRYYYD